MSALRWLRLSTFSLLVVLAVALCTTHAKEFTEDEDLSEAELDVRLQQQPVRRLAPSMDTFCYLYPHICKRATKKEAQPL
ncbi:hypothetical protein AAVH_05149 [Aphelenchoides avenae]|nr:hypothetical protein AAVH_05149 [Aphelenchus avenae]